MGTCGNVNHDLLHDVCYEEEIKDVAEVCWSVPRWVHDAGHAFQRDVRAGLSPYQSRRFFAAFVLLDHFVDCWANPFRADNGYGLEPVGPLTPSRSILASPIRFPSGMAELADW